MKNYSVSHSLLLGIALLTIALLLLPLAGKNCLRAANSEAFPSLEEETKPANPAGVQHKPAPERPTVSDFQTQTGARDLKQVAEEPPFPEEPAFPELNDQGAKPPPPPEAVAPQGQNPIAPSVEQAPKGKLEIENRPEAYTIQQGDTLWDLCQRFFGNPFLWPKLWSYNDYVRNPHFIYPGQQIRFIPGTETEPPSLDIGNQDVAQKEEVSKPQEEEVPTQEAATNEQPQAKEKSEDLEIVAEGKDGPKVLRLTDDSFLADDEPSLGEIVSSFNASEFLTNGDTVYVDFKNASAVSIGDRFTIFEKLRTVRHPRSWFTTMGSIIATKGYLQVVDVQDNIYAAKIFNATHYIKRGDSIKPYLNPYKEVTPKEPQKFYEGYFVATKFNERFLGLDQIGYIDLGTKAGVQIGDTFLVYRTKDGFTNNNRNFPKVVIGSLVVIETKDKASTVICTHAIEAIEPGDKLMSQRARFRFLN